jgi:hypothetical protein
MMKYKVMIGDIPCWWYEFKSVNKYGVKKYCPLCGEELCESNDCILIINNQKLFPNVWCHTLCVPNGLTEEVVLLIKKHYEDSVVFLKKALESGKPWFHYIKI